MTPVCIEKGATSLVEEATFSFEIVEFYTQNPQPSITYDSANGKLIYYIGAEITADRSKIFLLRATG